MNKDFQQLRKVFEGGDPFMTGGHQVVGMRKRKRVIPEWTRNNKIVRELLLRSFPKLLTNPKQRAAASRWARIIHLFFRLQWTHRQVAEELGATPGCIHTAITGIKRVAVGRRYDNRALLGAKPVGRPRTEKIK
jgi:hypothetical protein